MPYIAPYKRSFHEVMDLYLWGARIEDICMLYEVHKRTLRKALREEGIKLRPPQRLLIATPNKKKYMIKSIRPRIPEGVRLVDGDQAPDRLLRSSAHAQRDRRIEERRLDVSMRSCREEAF